MTIASLVVKLTANAAEFHREMESAARRIERTGKMIARAGREMSEAISLPIIAAGVVAFRAMLEESSRSFGPLFLAVQGLKNEFHNLALGVGRELQPYFLQFIDLLTRGIRMVEGWVEAFHNLSPTLQKVIIYTLGFLAALGPTLLVVGKLVAAVGAFIKVLGFLISPAGLVALAIIALAAAAIYVATHWEEVKLRLELVWIAIKVAVFEAAQAIVGAFAAMLEAGAAVSDSLGGMPGIMGGVFQAMAAGSGKAAEALRGLQERLDQLSTKALRDFSAKGNEFQNLITAGKNVDGFAHSTTILDEVLKSLQGRLELNVRTARVLGETFNLPTAQAREFHQAIEEALKKGVDPMSKGMQQLGKDFQTATELGNEFARAVTALGPTLIQQTKAAAQFKEMIAAGVSPHIAAEALMGEGKIIVDVMQAVEDSLAAIGERIGNIFAGVSHGFRGFLGVLAGITGALLKQVGTTLVHLGIMAIAMGKLGIAIKNFAKNPALAIATGIALIALGQTFAAKAEQSASAGFSGGDAGSSASASATAGGNQQGSTDLILRLETPDGLVDSVFRDPRNRLALAKVLEDISNRKVTTVFASAD